MTRSGVSKEADIMKSVVDLATATRENSGSSSDWLTFDTLAAALKEVCCTTGISNAIEQRCYHALLKMSAEPEEHLTWWDKLHQLHRYLPHQSQQLRKQSNKTSTSFSTNHNSFDTSQRPFPGNSTLIRLNDSRSGAGAGAATATPPRLAISAISGSSPGSLIEGEHLSMLLNSTGKFNRKPFAAAATVIGGAAQAAGAPLPAASHSHSAFYAGAYAIDGHGTATPAASASAAADGHSATATPAAGGVERNGGRIAASNGLLDTLVEVAQRVDSIEKETRNTRDMIAQLSPTLAPRQQQQQQIQYHEQRRNRDTSAAAVATASDGVPALADRFLPPPHSAASAPLLDAPASPLRSSSADQHDISGVGDISSALRAQGERSSYPKSDALRSRVLLPDSPPKATGSAIGEFSNLLRMSKAMMKYMDAPDSSSSRIRAAAGYEQDSTVTLHPHSQNRSGHDKHHHHQQHHQQQQQQQHSPMHSVDRSFGAAADAAASSLGSPSRADMSSFGGRGGGGGSRGGGGGGGYFSPPLLSPVRSTARAARDALVSPIDYDPASLQEQLQQLHLQQRSGGGRSRNVADAISSVQQQRSSSQRFTPLGEDFLLDRRGHLDVDALDIDTRCLPRGSSSDAVAAVVSAVHVLLSFRRWMLDRAAEHRAAGDAMPSAVCALHAHLQQQSDFVTSLFGLEQWLRDHIKQLLQLQIAAYVFQQWHRQFGVPPAARVYRLRAQQRRGFEALLENSLRRRMRRKNALHALALRRRHVNAAHMTPSLQRRAPRNHQEQHAVDGSAFSSSSSSRGGRMSFTGDVSRDIAELSTARQRQQLQQQLYFSSLRVRDLLNDSREALIAMSRGGGPQQLQQRAVSLREYHAAQHSVALLFAFRRLHHRALLLPRLRRVRAATARRSTSYVLQLWRDMWQQRRCHEQQLEPRVQQVHSRVLLLRVRRAFQKLLFNVSSSAQERRALEAYAVRIRARPVHLRALHMLRCAAYVRCFLRLRKHYEATGGLLPEMRRFGERHHTQHLQREYLRRWAAFRRRLSDQRREGCRTRVSQFVLLLLLRRRHAAVLQSFGNQHTPVATFLAAPAVQRLHVSALLMREVALLEVQWRCFVRLRSVGRCPRVFFSLLELRFAQSLSRRALPSERRKYLRMANEASCRILPTQFLRRLVREKVQLERQYATVRAPPSQQQLLMHSPQAAAFAADGASPTRIAHRRSGSGSRHVHISDSHHADFNSSRLVTALTASPAALASAGPGAAADAELQELYDRVTDRCVGNATIAHYLPPEKPYLLVHVQPATLALVRRTLYNSTPFEPHEESDRLQQQHLHLHAHPSGNGSSGSSVLWSARFLSPYHRQPMLAVDGTAFASTPMLLRMTRRWRQYSATRAHLRRLHDAVARVVQKEVLGLKWQLWRALFEQQVQCNVVQKRRSLLRLRCFIGRHPALRSDHIVGQRRALRLLHWQRWLDAHSRHVDLRRLHAGHFYNRIADGARKVLLHFVTRSAHVPFSLRHFLVQFPTYRFPVHERQPNPLLWEQQQHHSAHLALLAISRHHHYHPHHRAESVREQGSAHFNAATHLQLHHLHPQHRPMHQHQLVQDTRPLHLRESYHNSNNNSSTSMSRRSRSRVQRHRYADVTTAESGADAADDIAVGGGGGSGVVPGIAALASAAIFMSSYLSAAIRQFYRMRRALLLLRDYARMNRRIRGVVEVVEALRQREVLRTLRRRVLLRAKCNALRCKQRGRWMFRMRFVCVQQRYHKQLLRQWLGNMSRRYRYRLLSRVYAKSWRGKVYGAWQKLQLHAESVRFKRTVLQQWMQQRLLTRCFFAMQSLAAVSSWRRHRLLHGALVRICRSHNRRLRWERMPLDVAHVYRAVRSYSLLRAVLFSWRRQQLSDAVALNFRRKTSLIRGLCALRQQQVLRLQKQQQQLQRGGGGDKSMLDVLPTERLKRRLVERLQQAVSGFRAENDLFLGCPFRGVEFMQQPAGTMQLHARTLRRQSLVGAFSGSALPGAAVAAAAYGGELQVSPPRASLYGSPLKYPTPRSWQPEVTLNDTIAATAVAVAAAASTPAPSAATTPGRTPTAGGSSSSGGCGGGVEVATERQLTVADRIAGARSPAVSRSVAAVLELQGAAADYRPLSVSSSPAAAAAAAAAIRSPHRAAEALESPLAVFSRSFSVDVGDAEDDSGMRSLRPESISGGGGSSSGGRFGANEAADLRTTPSQRTPLRLPSTFGSATRASALSPADVALSRSRSSGAAPTRAAARSASPALQRSPHGDSNTQLSAPAPAAQPFGRSPRSRSAEPPRDRSTFSDYGNSSIRSSHNIAGSSGFSGRSGGGRYGPSPAAAAGLSPMPPSILSSGVTPRSRTRAQHVIFFGDSPLSSPVPGAGAATAGGTPASRYDDVDDDGGGSRSGGSIRSGGGGFGASGSRSGGGGGGGGDSIGALTEENLSLHEQQQMLYPMPSQSPAALRLSIASDSHYGGGGGGGVAAWASEPSRSPYPPSARASRAVTPSSERRFQQHYNTAACASAASAASEGGAADYDYEGAVGSYFRDDLSEFSTVSGGGIIPRAGGGARTPASRRALPLTSAERVTLRRQLQRWRRLHHQQLRPMEVAYHRHRRQQLYLAMQQLLFEAKNRTAQLQLIRRSTLHHAMRLLKQRLYAVQDANEVESFAANFHIALRLKRCMRCWRQQVRQRQRHLKRLKTASNFRICRKRSIFFVMLRAICQHPRIGSAAAAVAGGGDKFSAAAAATSAPRMGLSRNSINKLMQHTK